MQELISYFYKGILTTQKDQPEDQSFCV